MIDIYVDGQHGTTGLEIKKLIQNHPQFKLVEIDYEDRHDVQKRKHLMNTVDAVVLCLPETASLKALALVENKNVVVLDTSTAFRCSTEWVYGLPEISALQKKRILDSKRIANPGCHASAAILALLPIIDSGLLKSQMPLTFVSHTGFSGGGKNMIETYLEGKDNPSVKHYALDQSHKHIPEIMKYLHLNLKPIFLPLVCNYERGILLSVPFHQDYFKAPIKLETLHLLYKDFYKDSVFARVVDLNDEQLISEGLSGEKYRGNAFEIMLMGNDETFQIAVGLDNLGKGASGAAIQNLNIVFGFDETLGL